MPQKPNESAMDYLRRLTGWLDYNDTETLDKLPSIEALVEFFELISDEYDVSTYDEVIGVIENEGAKAAKPLIAFWERYDADTAKDLQAWVKEDLV
jgi:hypothetical protein